MQGSVEDAFIHIMKFGGGTKLGKCFRYLHFPSPSLSRWISQIPFSNPQMPSYESLLQKCKLRSKRDELQGSFWVIVFLAKK